jgi:hypothetical protein
MLLISCRSTPILNIEDQSFSLRSSAKPALTQITRQIITAGDKLGWKMTRVKPGHIIATIHLRRHMAKVDIRYSNTKYSITYKDSLALKYDGESIHKNYNGWVQNLSNAINTQVYNSTQM